MTKRKKKPVILDMDNEELLERISARFDIASDAEKEQRQRMLEDLKFCSIDGQWEEGVRHQREQESKPCITVDRITPFISLLTNDQMKNAPALKVSPVNNGSDQDTADVLTGLFRHIEYASNAALAYVAAYQSCVRMGKGFIRVINDLEDQSNPFEQCLRIMPIDNPFQVYLDPTYQMPDGSDIAWALIVADMSFDEFKTTYPDSELTQVSDSKFCSLGDQLPAWIDKNDGGAVRVAEYFEQVKIPIKMHKMKSGRIIEGDAKELGLKDSDIEQSKDHYKTVVQIYKTNGLEILEGCVWPGKHIPIAPLFGNCVNVNGRRDYAGLIRFAKGPQVIFNYSKSAMAEAIALAPKSPWTGPKGFMGDREHEWRDSNRRNIVALEYEHWDEEHNCPLPPPARTPTEANIQALVEAVQLADQDLKSTTGIYDPSMGVNNSDQSGLAITRLQQQSQTTNYNFADALSHSIRIVGTIILEMLPYIYNTQRVIRIIGQDDKHSLVTINGPDQQKASDKIFDVTTGLYHATIASGPNYQTKRQEAQAVMIEMLKTVPALGTAAPDIIVSQLDIAIAEQLTERLRKTLPASLQDEDSTKDVPPAIAAQLQQLQSMNQELTSELQKLTDHHNEKQMELQSKERIAILENETKLAVAAMSAKAAQAGTMMDQEMQQLKAKLMVLDQQGQQQQQQHEMQLQLQQQQHDQGMQMDQQQHEQGMAQIQAQQAAQQPKAGE